MLIANACSLSINDDFDYDNYTVFDEEKDGDITILWMILMIFDDN
jgi:hypothetical protein